jgi:hypothetical protein
MYTTPGCTARGTSVFAPSFALDAPASPALHSLAVASSAAISSSVPSSAGKICFDFLAFFIFIAAQVFG